MDSVSDEHQTDFIGYATVEFSLVEGVIHEQR
jgi:hypothetical protein